MLPYNPFPNKLYFCVCNTNLLKTFWEKEKLIVSRNFSVSDSVLQKIFTLCFTKDFYNVFYKRFLHRVLQKIFTPCFTKDFYTVFYKRFLHRVLQKIFTPCFTKDFYTVFYKRFLHSVLQKIFTTCFTKDF